MLKKTIGMLVLCCVVVFALAGCAPDAWKQEFDTSLDLSDEGWKLTLYDEFVATDEHPEGDTKLNPAVWTTSPHGLRKEEYWCDQMVEVRDGRVIVRSEKRTDHDCAQCVDQNGNRVREGLFTSGIEGRQYVEENGELVEKLLFTQAFGYYEVSVRVPRGDAMWSAFWLQSASMRKVGNEGRDGSEIDVYESSFWKKNPTKTGSCIHYDGYDLYHGTKGNVTDTGTNLYDGAFHTYALKWSPEAYVFYVDGEPVWATDAGGVSRVPEFMRLTVEIRQNAYMPYGQTSKLFQNVEDDSQDFEIEYVKVYQNDAYVPHIMSDADFKDHKKQYDGLIIGGSVLGGLLLIGAASIITVVLVRKKRRKA